MAELSYSAIMRFSRTLAKIATKARDELRAALSQIDFTDQDVAIERVCEVMRAIADKYGLGARELAAQWYDYCRQLGIGKGFTAGIGESTRYSMESDIVALADKLSAGEITLDEFTANLGGVMVGQIHRDARNTILANLSDDYQRSMESNDTETASKMGFCRVPVAGGCAFCVLLASRSYYPWQQYKTAGTAGEAKKYHDDCRCVIVPFTKAMSIPGYSEKLDGYNNAYREADNARRSGMMPNGEPMPEELKLRIANAKAEHTAKFKRGEVDEPWRSINEDLIIMRWNNPALH
jgi:hypothetical protein